MRAVVIAAVLLAAPAVACAAESTNPFAYFVGHWRCAGVFPASGKPIASTLTFERDETSGALLKHHDDTPPGSYHALELWGFVKGGGFSDAMFDSYSGVRLFVSPGWSGDVLTWSNDPAATPAQRFTYMRLSPTRMRVDWSVYHIDRYAIGDTLTCDRV